MAEQNGMEPGLTLPVGTVLRGSYRIDGYLASGGFGNTYVATDQRFGGKVAVKEFFMRGVSTRGSDNITVSITVSQNRPLFDEQMQKFRKEAQRLHNLDSKHIVKVSDLFDENGTTYYVMEFIDGGSVADILKARNAPLDESTAMNCLQQVLEALEVAHNQGLWHLDIKPQNIMVTRQGVAKLIDFGASKQLKAGGGATTSTGLSFTPGYAPREQVEQNYSKFGPWTDLYSLGATLYRMVTNQKPPLPSDIDDDGPDAFTFPTTLSPKTRELILWLMQPTRTKRPQSTTEVQQWLMGFTNLRSGADPVSETTVLASDKAAKAKSIPEHQSKERQNSQQSEQEPDAELQHPIANPNVYLWISIVACVIMLAILGINKLDPDDIGGCMAFTIAIITTVILSLRVRFLNKNGKYEQAVHTEQWIILIYLLTPIITLFVRGLS